MLFLNYPLINTNVGMSKDNAKTVMLTPENIVVYLSSTLRLHSSSYTPYFRNVKNQVKIWLRQSDVMLRIVMLFAMLTVM